MVWIKTVRTTSPDADGAWATASRWRLNCAKRTLQTLQASDYDKNGDFRRSYSNASKEAEVLPDSTGEGMLRIACQTDFPKNKSGRDYFKLESNDIFQAARNYYELINSRKDQAPQ